MTLLQIIFELEEALHRIDAWINDCYTIGIDCSFLSVANAALTSQIAEIKQKLEYKMEQYEVYGEPLDETGIADLRELIEEMGYDQVLVLLGDSVATVLSETIAEEEIYRV